MMFPKVYRAKKRKPTGISAASRRAVDSRSGGRCEASEHAPFCNGRGEHKHHRRLRSQGGTDHPSNLLNLSLACHTYWHLHPEQARELGIIVSGYVGVIAS